MRSCGRNYLREAADARDWRFAPLDGTRNAPADLRGLAPMWLVSAKYDPCATSMRAMPTSCAALALMTPADGGGAAAVRLGRFRQPALLSVLEDHLLVDMPVEVQDAPDQFLHLHIAIDCLQVDGKQRPEARLALRLQGADLNEGMWLTFYGAHDARRLSLTAVSRIGRFQRGEPHVMPLERRMKISKIDAPITEAGQGLVAAHIFD